MTIPEIIIIALVVLVLAVAVIYIYKAKKRGEKCIGCPYSKQCQGNCNGSCNKQ